MMMSHHAVIMRLGFFLFVFLFFFLSATVFEKDLDTEVFISTKIRCEAKVQYCRKSWGGVSMINDPNVQHFLTLKMYRALCESLKKNTSRDVGTTENLIS